MNKFNGLGGYLLVALVLAWYVQINRDPINMSLSETELEALKNEEIKKPDKAQEKAYFHSRFVSGDLTKEVHSATATPLSDGNLIFFWYGGEREGSADVAIYSRRLHTQSGQWSEISRVVERSSIVHDLHRNIRKLGNPIAFEYAKNELWLFYVSVSVGGWAGSAINMQKSYDNGKTWSAPQRLISSPFFNISTLVKERPIRYQDGSIGLPVYHEFLGKFSEILYLDRHGVVLDKYRISSQRQAIQPVLIPFDDKQIAALMRNVDKQSHRRLWYSQSMNGGKNWQPISPLKIPNPNAAVSTISYLRPNILLMAFNNHPKERSDLTLGLSLDGGKNWDTLTVFEQSGEGDEHNPFSYPFLVQTRDERFHLFYTWKRKKIKYISFNPTQLQIWIEEKGLQPMLQKEVSGARNLVSHH